jgi:hypothetical protein
MGTRANSCCLALILTFSPDPPPLRFGATREKGKQLDALEFVDNLAANSVVGPLMRRKAISNGFNRLPPWPFRLSSQSSTRPGN